MLMKKITLLALSALVGAGAAYADGKTIVLDLAKSTTELTFNAETGAWDKTYDEDATSINSQVFSFVHNAMSAYDMWWGFTASNSADNARQENTLKFQFSNMAKGGIVLGDDGEIKLDSYGAPVTSADMPYLVGYYSEFNGEKSCQLAFNDGKSYAPQGVYVNLNSYPYYTIEYGDQYARAFNNGDSFKLIIHGVAADESEKTVSVELAAYENGNLTINRGWRYVDLSSLGTVDEMYFTMTSTDVGEWGVNTPTYFCLDKLTVLESTGGVSDVAESAVTLSYDREAMTVNVAGADFAIIADTMGRTVMSGEQSRFDISHLPAGVYVVKAGNSRLKIAK